MKRLKTFLTNNPSYVKCGVQRLVKATNLSERTVVAFRKTNDFKILKQQYLSKAL